MAIFGNLFLMLLAAAAIWFFAGLLLGAIDRVAKRFHQQGFTVAFFVLGFLTSISEISVMANSVLDGVPQVSAGNLIGASFVIIMLILPLLAALNRGISIKKTLDPPALAMALAVIAAPLGTVLDGQVSASDGWLMLVLYACLVYMIRRGKQAGLPEIALDMEEALVQKRKATALDGVKILIGGICIFAAGNVLVEQSVYFSGLLRIPGSVIGLLVLSLGTNVPELVVAIRSLMQKRRDLALGDYLGSAVANTVVFGALPLLGGRFAVEPSEFWLAAILGAAGFPAFFLLAKSQNTLSRQESLLLLALYGLFAASQIFNLARLAGS